MLGPRHWGVWTTVSISVPGHRAPGPALSQNGILLCQLCCALFYFSFQNENAITLYINVERFRDIKMCFKSWEWNCSLRFHLPLFRFASTNYRKGTFTCLSKTQKYNITVINILTLNKGTGIQHSNFAVRPTASTLCSYKCSSVSMDTWGLPLSLA